MVGMKSDEIMKDDANSNLEIDLRRKTRPKDLTALSAAFDARFDPKRAFDPSTEIRVLILDEGDDLSPISASLKIIELNPRGSSLSRQGLLAAWSAVSYAWEDQTPSCCISIDGEARYVTRNVHQILSQLWKGNTKRSIWIDALCIDQNNNNEKALQVAMMQSIYEQAAEVVVWLSSKDNSAALAVAEAAQWLENGQSLGIMSTQEPLLVLFRSQSPFEHCRAPFHQVLEMPWFQRIWVVQEAAVAKKLHVHLGGQVLPWDLFASAIFRFMSYLDADEAIRSSLSECFVIGREKGYGNTLPYQVGLTMVHLVSCLREWSRSSRSMIPLSGLVSMCRAQKATLAVDMIYAVNGLFESEKRAKFSSLGSKAFSSPPLHIDYELPIVEVYMNFTTWCLLHEGNLDVLAQQRYDDGCHYSTHSLPTWAADWSKLLLDDFKIAERTTISMDFSVPSLSLHLIALSFDVEVTF